MPIRNNNVKAERTPPTPGKTSDIIWSWSKILDAFPEALSIHALSGELKWANRKLCDIYQRPLSELQGLHCEQVFHSGNAVCPHDQVLSEGRSAYAVDDDSVPGKTHSIAVEPLFDEENQLAGFIRVMRDVTKERATQEQLLSSQRFATLGQLFSGIAHDVGTPLNVISGYAEFLLMRKRPDEPGHKELNSILDQTRRIAAILSQGLDLARPSKGSRDAILLDTLMTETLSLASHHLRKTDVRAVITCRIADPLIYGEASQLKQAFFNLLLNAGQRVGPAGKLQVLIEETSEQPGFLKLMLSGAGANGDQDFSEVSRRLSAEGETAIDDIGLDITRQILAEAGVRICSIRGEQGIGLAIYLPVNPPVKVNN